MVRRALRFGRLADAVCVDSEQAPRHTRICAVAQRTSETCSRMCRTAALCCGCKPLLWSVLALACADTSGAQWTSRNYSVVTGSHSIYPLRDGSPGVQLPPALRPQAVGAGPGYTFPESQHPNLRFWFTPEALDELNLANGARVKEWRNVANLCYHGHASTECTHERKNEMKPMAHEILAAPTEETAPEYVKEAVVLQAPVSSAFRGARELRYRGAVRFSRRTNAASIGQELRLYTRPGSQSKEGFTTNPFNGSSPGAAGKYTIFMVARTRQQPGDTGSHPLLHLSSPGGAGLTVHQRSVECIEAKGGGPTGSVCQGKAACARCTEGAYGVLGTYSLTFGSGEDDNSCASDCSNATVTHGGSTVVEQKTKNTGCTLSHPPAACLDAQGADHMMHFGRDWKVIAVRVDGGEARGYVNGAHAMHPPPLHVTAPAPDITGLRLGATSKGGEGQLEYGNVDIAEVLLYDDALSPQEMDRIGYYLAVKFGISSPVVGGNQRVNADAGSITRSVAVTKGCGCPVTTIISSGSYFVGTPPCRSDRYPYCEALGVGGGGGGGKGGGSCTSDSFRVRLLPRDQGGGGRSTEGGDWFEVEGAFLLPSDVSPTQASGILGGPSNSASSGPSVVSLSEEDLNKTAQYLAVSLQHPSRSCGSKQNVHNFGVVRMLSGTGDEGKGIARQTGGVGGVRGGAWGVPEYCATFGHEAIEEVWAAECIIHRTLPRNGTAVPNISCAAAEAPSPLPRIRCRTPPGDGAGNDVRIYWHGIPLILNAAFDYAAPSVTSLFPSTVSWAGAFVGEYHGHAHQILVTVTGLNFGPRYAVGDIRWEAKDGGPHIPLHKRSSGPRYSDWARGGAVKGVAGRGAGGGDGEATASDPEASHAEVVVEFPLKGAAGGQFVACLDSRWESHTSLVCSLPPIPQRQLVVDTGSGTMKAQIRVIAADQMSDRHGSAELVFRHVPAFHICDNAGLKPVPETKGWTGVAGVSAEEVGGKGGDRARIGGRLDNSGIALGLGGAGGGHQTSGARHEGSGGEGGLVELFGSALPGRGKPFPQGRQQECFKCCRSACIVDEFAHGAKRRGSTYGHCDHMCAQYCGYVKAEAVSGAHP